MLRSEVKVFCAGLIVCLMTTGCAGLQSKDSSASQLEAQLASADAAKASGDTEKTITALKSVATHFPAEKEPWLRMAQIRFDEGTYAEAIGYAQEVLRRDPKDKVANSIIAVGGLRLTTKALNDLRAQNDLNGSVRLEAQGLAKILRDSLGETVLVPAKPRAATAPAPSKAATSAGRRGAPARGKAEPDADTSTNANPFGALQ